MSLSLNNIPNGWATASFGELGKWIGGGTPSKSNPTFWKDGKIPWVSPKDMKSELILDTLDHITEQAIHESSTCLVQCGAILIVTRSGILQHSLPVAITARAVTLNQDLKAFIIHAPLNAKFILSFLKAREQNILQTCTKRGTTVASVVSTRLKKYETPLPPLNEQRRIVAKIEALTARSRRAKQALDAIPTLLERFRQSVLASAFRGDLTADWRAKNPDVEPASVLLERIRVERRRRWEETELAKMRAKGKEPKDNKWKAKYKEPAPVDTTGLPELPEGWCWARLTDCGEMGRGKSKHRPRNDSTLFGGPYPFIQTGDVARSSGLITMATTFYNEKGLAQSKLFPVGTVCITIAANIADSAILAIEACFPDSVVGIIPIGGLTSPEYLEYFIRTARSDLARFAPATAQKNINLAILNEVIVPIPPAFERKVIEKTLAKAMSFAASVKISLHDASLWTSALNQSILAKAFRGELVPQDPNDEPASVLLERIRAERQLAEAKKPKRGSRKQGSPRKAKQDEQPAQPDPEPVPPLPNELDIKLSKPVPVSPPVAPGPINTIQRPEFLDLDAVAQIQAIHEVLLGLGPLSKEQAIRQAADRFKETGVVSFQRLRSDGPLYHEIQKAIEAGIRRGLIDRPKRGQVRAILSEAGAYTQDHWRRCLLHVLDGVPTDRDEVIHVAAVWAQYHMGLQFKRLRRGGLIDKGLRSAINSGIRRGEVERVGANKIKGNS